MNSKRAAKIRKVVYGDMSPRIRKYRIAPHAKSALLGRGEQIVADPLRQAYQSAKKAWTRRKR